MNPAQKYLDENGQKQKVLAQKAGIAESVLSRYLKTGAISKENGLKLASALNLTLEAILFPQKTQ